MAPYDSSSTSTARSAPPRQRLKPRDIIVRAAVVELLRDRSGRPEPTPNVIERVYGGCQATSYYFARAAVSPAMTTVPGWAAELVGDIIVDFLGDMVRESAFAALATFALNVDGPGRRGFHRAAIRGRRSAAGSAKARRKLSAHSV